MCACGGGLGNVGDVGARVQEGGGSVGVWGMGILGLGVWVWVWGLGNVGGWG